MSQAAKRKRYLIAAFCFALGFVGVGFVGTAHTLTDPFERANSNTAENGQVENNHARLKGNTANRQPPVASQAVVSPIGFDNIQFYYSQGDGSEANDILNVFWGADSTKHISLADHLFTREVANVNLVLPNAAGNIPSESVLYNDRARVDYVLATGDTLASAAVTDVPEPSSFALLAGGLVAYGIIRRRRRQTCAMAEIASA